MCLCIVAQLCLTLCSLMDCSLPDSSVYGISQARIMEWVAISSPGDLPDPGIKSTFPMSPALKEDSLPVEPSGKLLNLNVTVQYTTYCVRVLLLFEIEEFSSFVLSHSVVSNSLRPMDCSLPGSSVHWDSPGKNTGVGCHALFQGIFPTQGWNPGLPDCGWVLYHLSH